jgi:hypothetical protein
VPLCNASTNEDDRGRRRSFLLLLLTVTEFTLMIGGGRAVRAFCRLLFAPLRWRLTGA